MHVFFNLGSVPKLTLKLAQEYGVPVGPHLGGRLATTSVATKNNIIFSFFSFGTSVRRCSGRRSGVAVQA